MNARDFCYWLQGYNELTDGARPSQATWVLMVEHLVIAYESEDYSHDTFIEVVNALMGFAEIDGLRPPGKRHWESIVKKVAAGFDKITSSSDEATKRKDESIEDLIVRIKEALKTPINPSPLPYIPPPIIPTRDDNLWQKPFDIICSTTACGPISDNFCASAEGKLEIIDLETLRDIKDLPNDKDNN